MQTLYLESSHRISGTADDFNYSLNKTLDVDSFLAHSVQMINCCANIDSTNNVIIVNEPTGAGTDVTITIIAGEYTAVQLAAELATVLNADATLTGVYTVSTDAESRTFLISSTVNFTVPVALTTLATRLGYTGTGTNHYTNVSSALSHTTWYLLGNLTAYIHCEELSSNAILNSKQSSVIKKIVLGDYGRAIFDESQNALEAVHFVKRNMSSLHIWLSDADGNKLTSSYEWSMTITFGQSK